MDNQTMDMQALESIGMPGKLLAGLQVLHT